MPQKRVPPDERQPVRVELFDTVDKAVLPACAVVLDDAKGDGSVAFEWGDRFYVAALVSDTGDVCKLKNKGSVRMTYEVLEVATMPLSTGNDDDDDDDGDDDDGDDNDGDGDGSDEGRGGAGTATVAAATADQTAAPKEGAGDTDGAGGADGAGGEQSVLTTVTLSKVREARRRGGRSNHTVPYSPIDGARSRALRLSSGLRSRAGGVHQESLPRRLGGRSGIVECEVLSPRSRALPESSV